METSPDKNSSLGSGLRRPKSPRRSSSGSQDQEQSLQFLLDERQKDATKEWSSNTIALYAIIGLICLLPVVFVVFDRASSAPNPAFSPRPRHRAFRQYNDFYPCEDIGLADPICADPPPKQAKPDRSIDRLQAFSYVSKTDPPPGFEKWLQFARDNKCQLGSYSQIERDLEAFRDSTTGKVRILKHHVEGAKKLPATAVFTIKDGLLTVSGEDVPGLNLHATLSSYISRYVHDLPDLEFVVNINDQPRVIPGHANATMDERLSGRLCQNATEDFHKYRHLHGYINNKRPGPEDQPTSELVALFSQAKIGNCHRDIMHPSVYTVNNMLWPHEHGQLKPWSERDNIMFFRGSTTGGIFKNMNSTRLNHRHRAVAFARNKTEYDVKFTDIIQCDDDVCEAMEAEYGHVPRVPEMENFDHKYLLAIDGNSFLARLPKYLGSASLVFRMGMFDEWFEERLEPGVHYIRVALDLSDLEEKLQWAKDHDEEARRIGLQARSLAFNYIRREDMECYMYRLLLEYANVLELDS